MENNQEPKLEGTNETTNNPISNQTDRGDRGNLTIYEETGDFTPNTTDTSSNSSLPEITDQAEANSEELNQLHNKVEEKVLGITVEALNDITLNIDISFVLETIHNSMSKNRDETLVHPLEYEKIEKGLKEAFNITEETEEELKEEDTNEA